MPQPRDTEPFNAGRTNRRTRSTTRRKYPAKRGVFRRRNYTQSNSYDQPESSATYRPSIERRLGFPQSTIVPIRYSSRLQIVNNPGYGAYVFRAGDIYDPDQTSTGHQPMAFDTWSEFYPTWCVIGSKLSIQAFPGDVSVQAIPLVYGVLRTNDTTAPLLWPYEGFIEAGSAYRVVSSYSGAPNPGSVEASYSAKRWWGVKNVTDVDGLWGQTNSSCAKQTYYIVWAAPQDGSSGLVNTRFVVTIDYLVMFRNPNMLSQS